jgi:pilus assembly protein Flp/PilA
MTKTTRARDEGASAVEYAMIVSAVAAVVVLIIVLLGTVVHKSYSDSCAKIGSAMSSNTSQCR